MLTQQPKGSEIAAVRSRFGEQVSPPTDLFAREPQFRIPPMTTFSPTDGRRPSVQRQSASPMLRATTTEFPTQVRRRRRIAIPNIADRFFDLLEPLTLLQRNALIQHMADDYYVVNRPPTRQDVIDLIAFTIPKRVDQSLAAQR